MRICVVCTAVFIHRVMNVFAMAEGDTVMYVQLQIELERLFPGSVVPTFGWVRRFRTQAVMRLSPLVPAVRGRGFTVGRVCVYFLLLSLSGIVWVYLILICVSGLHALHLLLMVVDVIQAMLHVIMTLAFG